MASLADSLVSSASRKLPIRKRSDLQTQKQRYQGRIYYVVKDPVGLQYFRFEEEEFAILQMLDGQLSLEEIAEKFEAQFPPQTIRVEELQQFIGMLHRSGLVITGLRGQGEQLKKRRDEKTNKQRIATLSNILSVRFKGIDPERILTLLDGYVGWFFSWPMLIFNLMLMASAALLILVQFQTFQSRLPSFQAFFDAQNWLLLGAVLACTKVLHEFGHGLSCKRLGGECHEMGVMFLVLTPCLYCNVSDSWMLPNRWHRAAIGAAGMYVEIVLASLCTFLWWFSDPSTLLNNICLNIMFVSSVSTILFNANPLLRYDGYYILSDILEIPNLRQKATTILSRKLGKWCLGIEPQEDPFLPHRNQGWFALYSMAAAIYRWVVVFSILYFLNKVFEPYGLKVLGQAIALMALYGLLVQPLWKLYQYFKVPGRLGKVKRWRFITTTVVIVAVLTGVFSIPLPTYVYSSAIVQPRDAEGVYVEVEGVLEEIPANVAPGKSVEKGQVLARLSNPQLELAIIELEGRLTTLQERLKGLEGLSYSDDPSTRQAAQDQMANVKQSIASTESQLAVRRRDRERLTLRAPRAGVVITPELVPEPQGEERELTTWWGTPFDERNLGATLQMGTKFCQIGDPTALEARLLIPQNDVDWVQPGNEVRILLKQSAFHRYRSSIRDDKERNEVPVTPPQLSSLSGGSVPTQVDAAGVPRPVTPHYYAFASLPKDVHRLRIGLVGVAKITSQPRTLAQRLYRYAARTFNFEL